MTQSGDVLPSPWPFAGSLLETDVMRQATSEQSSVAVTRTATGVIPWSGGQRLSGVAEMLAIVGGVASGWQLALAPWSFGPDVRFGRTEDNTLGVVDDEPAHASIESMTHDVIATST